MAAAGSNDRIQLVDETVDGWGDEHFDQYLPASFQDTALDFSTFLTSSLGEESLDIDFSTSSVSSSTRLFDEQFPIYNHSASAVAIEGCPEKSSSDNLFVSESELAHPETFSFYLPEDFSCSPGSVPPISGSPTIERQVWRQQKTKHASRGMGEHLPSTERSGLRPIRKAASSPNFDLTGLSGVDHWPERNHSATHTNTSFLLSPPPSVSGGQRTFDVYAQTPTSCGSVDPRLIVGSSGLDQSQIILSTGASHSDCTNIHRQCMPQTPHSHNPNATHFDHMGEMMKLLPQNWNHASIDASKLQVPSTPEQDGGTRFTDHTLHLQNQDPSSGRLFDEKHQCDRGDSSSSLRTPPRTSTNPSTNYEPEQTRPRTPAFQVRKCKSSRCLRPSTPRPGRGALDFVNFTPNDSQKILTGVAPSGSSKTKARREKEALDKRKRLSQAAIRAVQAAGGDVSRLIEAGLCE
ncbi:hypothetical protein K3495_g6987 [Podosphaera aphanis]|nr:hypothetical protein K3495_g6987 [Podosphaera aphanis]